MPLVVGVRFKAGGKLYYFDPGGIEGLEVGDWAVVKTARGCELGEVILGPREVSDDEITGKLQPVQRRATAADAMQKQRCELRAKEALKRCREKVAESGLPMKIVRAEYSFDGKRLVFFFSAENRVDFRNLVKDLAKIFRTRIELRQIGVRDEARLLGGVGRCGRPLCCSSWLTDFSPVSIKMAKQQGLPLNPMEISGLCGRLLCCLAYEHPFYQRIKAKLPKKNKKVSTPHGTGIVRAVNVLRESVTVELHDDVIVEVTLEELEGSKPKDGTPEETKAPREHETRGPDTKRERQQRPPSSGKPKRRKRRPRRRRSRKTNGASAGKQKE